MNNMIDDDTLDIIEKHINELDSNGLYIFCNNVLMDLLANGLTNDGSYYTLGLFIMNMYNDDVESIVYTLLMDGFHKWDNIDEFNRVCGFTKKYYGEAGSAELDLGYRYRILLSYYGGLPSSKEDDKYIEVDIDYVRKNTDFTTTYCGTMPFIGTFVFLKDIPNNMRDKLYVGVKRDYNKWKSSGLHAAVTLNTYEQEIINGREGIEYDSIANVVKAFEDCGYGMDPNYVFCTALPKEIVEKYGWHIHDGNY